MTDNEIFEAVKQRFTDPKTMDLLRAGLADPEEMEDVKRAIRYGEASMKNPLLRDKLYKIFDRLLNVVKDDSMTRQMVKQDLKKLQSGDSAMSEDLNTANVEKAVMHDCAKHVVHEQWGKGQCIAGEHTLLDDGTVTHYDVMFEHGIEQDVPVADLTVLVSESHMHAKRKKAMEEETELDEKKLTSAEMKKREEVAKAIERDQPGMPMSKKMAIATATAKKVAEGYDPSPADIAKMLVKKHGKNVTKDHIKALEADRDSNKGLDHAEIMKHVAKLGEEKAHTVPKTDKEKSLAKLAPPHDKITHADVMVGRGVSKKKTMKEFVEQLAESLAPKGE